jgi:hypothetical protein
MSPTDHVHEWIEGPGYPNLLCAACGASHSAIQTILGEADDDARRVAGEAHYTGSWVHQESETLELWLSSAPPQVLEDLEALRPGVYEIHNDAAHPLGELLALQQSIDHRVISSQGIKVHGSGPRNDGYICAIPCPHCGESHPWTSWYLGEAIKALECSSHATRVVVEATEDGYSATALP